MTENIQWKRVAIYLAFAFGIAWATALVIFLTGQLANSPVIIPIAGGGIQLATILLAGVYMMAPAIAHILTRLITKEGWNVTLLKARIKRGWPYWLIAWVGPAILTGIGAVVFFAIFPQYYDVGLTGIQEQLDALAGGVEISPWLIIIAQVAQGVLIAPIINGFFTLGEEFGWRAYLQPHLMPMGERKTMLLMGVIWGVWHWPITAMGHNYGLNYTGYPWAGMLMMVLFTTALGTLLGWLTYRAGSVWPAVIGHAAMNGIAPAAILFTSGQPSLLLGPMPVGVIGMVGFLAVAAWILLSKKSFTLPEPEKPSELVVEASGE